MGKTKEEVKDLTVKETGKEVALTPGVGAIATQSMGYSEGVDRSDILMPMILLMQGQSELVGEEKAQIGDIVKSTTKKVIGNKNSPILFIPLLTFKTWRKFEKIGEKFEYRGQEPYLERDKDLPWTYEENGKSMRRDKAINVYGILINDLKADIEARRKLAETGEIPDTDAMCLPALIGFTRTGYQQGRVLSTHFSMADSYGIPPWTATFKLSTHMEKNDKGQFYVFDVEKVGKTEPELLAAAEGWYKILREGQLKVDESGLSETVEKTVSEVVPF